jgi:excisionase family DNA binding protein
VGEAAQSDLESVAPLPLEHNRKRKAADMAVAKNDHLLSPAEVAALFRVDSKTVTRWAMAGKISSIRTLGGHRRYRADEIRRLLSAGEAIRVVDVTDSRAEVIDIRGQSSESRLG